MTLVVRASLVLCSLFVLLAPGVARAQSARFDGGAPEFDASAVVDAVVADASSDAPRAPSECTPGDGRVAVRIGVTGESHCRDGFSSCTNIVSVRVDNCSARPVALYALAMRAADGRGINWEFAPRWVGPASSHTVDRDYPSDRDERLELDARVVDERGAVVVTSRASAETRNAARARAIAECATCSGVWGRWGMLGREGCNCRTADAGRACEDGADCESLCVPTGVRVVTPAVEPRCVCPAGCNCSSRGRAGVGRCSPVCEPGRPAMVVSVGRCAERRMNFGCQSYIPAGARAAGPYVAGGHRVSSRCAD